MYVCMYVCVSTTGDVLSPAVSMYHKLKIFWILLRTGFWSVTKNVDCLHYCVPGPIDQWTLFSYHAIIYTASGGNSSSSSSSSSSSDISSTVELDTYVVPENLKEGSTVKAARRNAIYLIQNGSRRVFPHAVSNVHSTQVE